MSNINIQQSLIEIEENLKQLDSARNQVLSIADSSHKLTDKVLFLVNNFQKLNENLFEENNTIIDQLSKHNNIFTERIHSVTGSIDSSVDSLLEKINVSSNRFSIGLDEVSQKYISNSEKLMLEKGKILDGITERHLDLSRAIEKIEKQLEVLDFHKQTEKILGKLESQEEFNKAIDKELTQTKNTLVESEQKITKLINHNSAFNTEKLESMNAVILNSKKNQATFFVTIIGLILVVLAVILLK